MKNIRVESYEMGLQISRSVYTEAKEEADFGGCVTVGGDIHELARHKESKIVEGHLMGIRACVSEYSAEVCGGECGRIHQGEKCHSDSQDVWWPTAHFTGENFWARGYFVSTVGLEENMVRAYIRNQEEEDERYEQMKLGM